MNIRELTLSLLDEYELSGKYVNLAISSHKTAGLTREEKKLLTALLYTSVEHKLTYDYYASSISKRSVDKIDLHTLNILRVGFCQILEFHSIPDHAAVNETVKLGRNKGERAFVNRILREAIRLRDSSGLPLPLREKNLPRHLSVKYSFPLWMTKHFVRLLGDTEAEALLQSFNSQRYTDLTVNTTRISRDEYLLKLSDEGYCAQLQPNSSLGIRIKGSVVPTELPGFSEGLFFVQDGACALSMEVLSPAATDRVIDVCACPGGKSFACSILMGGEGDIYSFDIHESKLSLISEGAERLGLRNITVAQRDATVPDEGLFCSFDKVICDVPCSGLGVLGKKPDLRYRDPSGLQELPQLQYAILEVSGRYLKEGGILLYSTCTLNQEENEGVVNNFLLNNPDFVLEDFSIGGLSSSDGMIITYPHRDATDGFFIAKLKKESKR